MEVRDLGEIDVLKIRTEREDSEGAPAVAAGAIGLVANQEREVLISKEAMRAEYRAVALAEVGTEVALTMLQGVEDHLSGEKVANLSMINLLATTTISQDLIIMEHLEEEDLIEVALQEVELLMEDLHSNDYLN